MTALTKKEIMTQLRKLGVKSVRERDDYLREYEVYHELQHPVIHSAPEYQKRTEDT